MRRKRNRLLAVLACCAAALSSCDLGDSYVPPRVIPGVSIDGVQLGDSRQSVEEKLGPIFALGNADGADRGWFQADYKAGPYAGLSIDYYDLGGIVGPVDLIIMRDPYQGKTHEGIGLASPLIAVHRTYGIPRNTMGPPKYGRLVEAYCFRGKFFDFEYQDSIVVYMSMGFYVPPASHDSIHHCD